MGYSFSSISRILDQKPLFEGKKVVTHLCRDLLPCINICFESNSCQKKHLVKINVI